MLSIRKLNPMVRAVGTMGVVAGLVGAVTFASLTSNTVALQNNSLAVTQDILRISSDGAFATTAPGFTDNNLIVGTEGSQHEFCMQNLANTDLNLSAQISGGDPTGIDVSQVIVHIYDQSQTPVLSKSIAELKTSAQAVDGQLNALATGDCVPGNNVEGNYYYSVTVNPAAVTGSTGSVSGFTLNFTGTSTT